MCKLNVPDYDPDTLTLRLRETKNGSDGLAYIDDDTCKEPWQLRPHMRLLPAVRAGFEVYARGSQRSMSKLVLEIAHRHATIKAPNRKVVPEHVRMDTMPVLASLVLVFDLL